MTFKKRDFTQVTSYPEAHTIDGEKVPPDGTKQPAPGFLRADTHAMPVGLSYPKGQDFGPYVQHIGEGLPSSFALDFTNDIPFSCGNVHPHSALMLFALALNQRPKTIVETGTFYGYSTLFLAKALEVWGEGMLHTIDPDQKLIPDNIKTHPHITCHQGRSEEYMPGFLADLGRVDFAFLDSWKRLGFAEFELVDPYIPPGGIVVFHDTQFLNTGHTLYESLAEAAQGYDRVLFSGTPHEDNPHHFFGNADDRGLLVLRKKEANPFLHVWDANSKGMGAAIYEINKEKRDA